MRFRVLLVILLLSPAPWASAWEADLADSTCRVVADFGAKRGMGSGCCFAIDARLVRILTNAHVVTSDSGQLARRVTCEFWTSGHLSRRLVATVVGLRRDATVDAAVLTIPLAAFGGRPPKAIPLDPTAVIRPGETLYSAGCPHGSWATAWKGHALRTTGGTVYFLPVPADGRSGSAIVRGTGDDARIVALLYARRLDEGEGVACTAAALFRRTQYVAPIADCPNCPDGQCDNRQFQLFGRQYGAEPDAQGNPYPTNPYPTLPGMTPMNPAPATPSVDPAVNSRLTALEAEVAAGRALVGKLGLLEASDDKIDSVVATLGTKIESTTETAELALVKASDAVDDVDEMFFKSSAMAAEAKEAADNATKAVDAVAADAKKSSGLIGWALGLAGTSLLGLLPGGGLALWAVKRSGASARLEQRARARAEGLVDLASGVAQGAMPLEIGDKSIAALAEAVKARL